MFGQSSTGFQLGRTNSNATLFPGTNMAQVAPAIGKGSNMGIKQPTGLSSIFGSTVQQNQQQAIGPNSVAKLPGLGITAPQTQSTSDTVVTPKTKYTDVPLDIKRSINELERFIQNQIHISSMIESRMCGETIQKISEGVKTSTQTLTSIGSNLAKDMTLAQGLLDSVNSELKNQDIINRFVEECKSGNIGGSTAQKSDIYIKYLMDLVDRLESSVKTYKARIDELRYAAEAQVSSSRLSPESVADVMKNQEKTFMVLARRTESLQHIVMDKLKEAALFRKKYFGDDSLAKYIAARNTRSKIDDYDLPSLEQMASEILIPISSLNNQ